MGTDETGSLRGEGESQARAHLGFTRFYVSVRLLSKFTHFNDAENLPS